MPKGIKHPGDKTRVGVCQRGHCSGYLLAALRHEQLGQLRLQRSLCDFAGGCCQNCRACPQHHPAILHSAVFPQGLPVVVQQAANV